MNRLKQILKGIDEQQIHSNDGWWETSTGADFGAKKINEIEQFFKEVTSQRQPLSDDEIKKCLSDTMPKTKMSRCFIVFARAIEKLHGIEG